MDPNTPATQADEVVEQQPSQDTPAGGDAPQPNAPQQEDYFLDVDERHRYKTREDAARSIQESGRRIGELTPWAEHAQRYGVNDPSRLPQIFDEYLQMRDQLQRLQGALGGRGEPGREQQQQLSPQDKANVEYLESRGFTRKEALDKVLQDRLSPLEQKVQALEAQLGRADELHTDAVVDAGRNYLGELMTQNGLPINNADLNGVIEDSIIAWMEASSIDRRTGNIIPGSLLDRFYAGGMASKEVVKQGFDRWFGTVNVLRQNADGQYQAQREANVRRTPKPLPRQGAPVPTEDDKSKNQATRRTPGAGGIFTDPAIHEKAWERMQEHVGR